MINSNKNERWKNVVGYEGLYQVSDIGRVKSFLRKGSHIPITQINSVRRLLQNKIKQCNIEKITGLSEATIYRIKHNKINYDEKILKLILANTGYWVVGLKRIGHNIPLLVHRLVLEAFVGPCPGGMECRHLDGNPRNNNLSNLKWGTRSENQQDSVRHGTKYSYFQDGKKINIGVNNPMVKLTEDNVKQIKRMKGTLTQRARAEMFNVSPSAIQGIDDGKTWSHIDVQ